MAASPGRCLLTERGRGCCAVPPPPSIAIDCVRVKERERERERGVGEERERNRGNRFDCSPIPCLTLFLPFAHSGLFSLFPLFVIIVTFKFLQSIFQPKPLIPTAHRDVKYIVIPYIGHNSLHLRNLLSRLFKKHFPSTDFRFVLINF